MKEQPTEIGRELKASELKVGTVVVVKTPQERFITVWVRFVDAQFVEFYAGELRWHIVNFIEPDGSIVDDQRRTIHVFEYLGTI